MTIIIVNFNTRDLTLGCIDSIRKSRSKVNYEIIVVDNASREPIKIKDVKIIYNKENLGFAKANNQGIKIAKGEYILLLNSDTLVERREIDKLYKFAKNTPDAGVVGARLLNSDATIQPSVFRFPTIGLAIRQYFLGQKNIMDKYYPKGNDPCGVDAVVGACFLITPKAMETVGGLNEKYFMYFEDIDYCRAVGKAGLKVYYLPTSEITHIHGASGGGSDYLVASSKIYHGIVGYYILFIIMWLGQKWEKLLKTGS